MGGGGGQSERRVEKEKERSPGGPTEPPLLGLWSREHDFDARKKTQNSRDEAVC